MDNVAAADEAHALGVRLQGGYLPGMSGGQLVDADGLVVGIIQKSGHNIGYGVDTTLLQEFMRTADRGGRRGGDRAPRAPSP